MVQGNTMPATQLSARLGVLQTEVDAALEEMAQTRVVARLWRKDHTLWKPEPRELENRLGGQLAPPAGCVAL